MRQIIPAIMILIFMESCANKLLTLSNTNEVYTFADESIAPEKGSDAQYVYHTNPDTLKSNKPSVIVSNVPQWDYYNGYNSYHYGCQCPGNYNYSGYGYHSWASPYYGYNNYYNYNGFGYRDPIYGNYFNSYPNYNYYGYGYGTNNSSGFNWFTYYGGKNHQPVNPGISRVRGTAQGGAPGTAGSPGISGTTRQAIQVLPGNAGSTQPTYQKAPQPLSSFSNNTGTISSTQDPSNTRNSVPAGKSVPVTAPVYQSAPAYMPDAATVPTFSNTNSDGNQSSGWPAPNYNGSSSRPQSNPAPVSPSGWQTTPVPQGNPQRNYSQPVPAPSYSSPTRTYSPPSPAMGGSGGGAPTRMSRPR